ncbi:MAG TPA: hypothetical protein VM597_18200, partial [Gemmataceae bacterium]|nr:hypothetical protein [Gemmataceae bacterium]
PAPPAALAKAILEQTGYTVDLSALDDRPVNVSVKKVEFWNAMDQLAGASDSRVVVSQGKIALKPGASKGPSHVVGPFRFTAPGVSIRGDVEAGTASYELGLAVAWEPGVHAYRIDGRPRITRATDDAGRAVGVNAGGSRSFTAWNSAPLSVFPTGVTRGVKSLTLEGSVTVTMADELMTFDFGSAVKPVGPPAQKGVSARAVKSAADGDDWVIEIELTYPRSDVVWESHEDYWLRNNVLRLLPPGGAPIKMDLDTLDRTIRYVAKGQGRRVALNWGLDYRTPGPMREVTVPFVLKNIPLP